MGVSAVLVGLVHPQRKSLECLVLQTKDEMCPSRRLCNLVGYDSPTALRLDASSNGLFHIPFIRNLLSKVTKSLKHWFRLDDVSVL